VLIATTSAGAKWFRRTPPRVTVRALSDAGEVRMRDVVKVAAEVTGGGHILTEGGATILGRFLDEGILDELFLTVAPRIAGRTREFPRVGLVEGAAFAAKAAPGGRLVSLKSAGDYLFTRYAFARD
jgi:riboflavin biosynthesis pyrimidine reductase